MKVVAHRWAKVTGTLVDIAVGNWRDGDYDPSNRQEKWMLENGYRIQRAYDGPQEPPMKMLPVKQRTRRHFTPLVVPTARVYEPQEYEQ